MFTEYSDALREISYHAEHPSAKTAKLRYLMPASDFGLCSAHGAMFSPHSPPNDIPFFLVYPF
jgi:hypothetical protein